MTEVSSGFVRLLRSAELARAYTLTTISALFSSFAIEALASRTALVTIILVLALLGAAILVARRRELTTLRFAPSSLIVFLLWALLSTFWSTDAADTLVNWLSLLGFTVLGITIGHIRDTLQTVRAVGDSLRVLLATSLGVEILSGILLDTPIPFLGVAGNLAVGGPIEGIFGTRNMLGFVTVIALITFVIEWRTRSVPPPLAIPSIALAALLAFFSASPTVLVLAVIVGIVTAALALVRHTSPQHRGILQGILAALVVAAFAAAFMLRHQIIAWLAAASDFPTRATLWNLILEFVKVRPIQGWGWYGPWNTTEHPYENINFIVKDTHQTALNSYFDVLLQLGVAGLLLFLLLGGVATVRSWYVASVRRSVLYAWTPLVLVALAVHSMFESFTLTGAGWTMLVLCALRAGQSRSWRENLDAAHTGVIPTLQPEKPQ